MGVVGIAEKVSIIVPVHNGSKYIMQCLDSILCQIYKNIELLVVNDHSTDDSVEKVISLQKLDSRIRILNSEKKGVSAARNLGIRNARGTYITFIDSDDIIEKDFIEKLIKGCSDKDVNLSACMYDNNMSLEVGHDNSSTNKILSADDMIKEVLLPYVGVGSFVWNKLYVLKIINDNNIYFDEKIAVCEDTLFNVRYLNYCKKVSLSNNRLYHYRINDTGAMYIKEFNYNKLSGNVAHDAIMESLKKEGKLSLRNYAVLGCMLYNIILAMQYYKYDVNNYRYWLDIYRHATINPRLFFLSKVNIKYKAGLVYLMLCLKYRIKKDVPNWK